MGVTKLQDAKLYIDDTDFTGQMNALNLTYGAQMRDVTTFGNDTVINAGGLKEVTFSHEGFWDGNLDNTIFNNLIGIADKAMTIAPINNGAVGEPCYIARAIAASYAPGASVGEALGFNVSGNADKLIKGIVLHNGSETATGNGTGYQEGAVASGAVVFASLHVLSASGTSPTLDVVVESDNNAGFATPITQLTFAQATGKTSQLLSLPGSITDDYWRITFTIGGTTPDFNFVVGLGII